MQWLDTLVNREHNQFASVETKHIVVKGNSTVLHRFQEQSDVLRQVANKASNKRSKDLKENQKLGMKKTD